MKSALVVLSVCLAASGAYADGGKQADDDKDSSDVKEAEAAAHSAKSAHNKKNKRAHVRRKANDAADAEEAAEDSASANAIEAVDAWGASSTASSSNADANPAFNLTPNWDAVKGPRSQAAYPWIEHHGYMRVRGDLFHNLDLDTWTSDTNGTSPVRPPLTDTVTAGPGHPENETADFHKGSDSLASTNMRFRYQPTFHVAENLRIHTTLDLLDNLVLGSTPETGILSSDDIATERYAAGQEAPADSIRVKHVWGEWQSPIGVIAFGRMPAQWGLGMLYNAGGGLDDDYGDAVDRIMATIPVSMVAGISNMYLSLSWDFPSEGVVGRSGRFIDQATTSGQAYDFDQRDDVMALSLSLFRKPLSQQEKDVRHHNLYDRHRWAIDWGAYGLFYHHDLLSEGQGTDVRLREVEATIYVPDAYVTLERHFEKNRWIKLGLEGAIATGKIKEVPQRASEETSVCYDTGLEADSCPGGDTYNPRRRELLQWGYAFELDYRSKKLHTGFRHGTASGDSTEGFGVLDQTAFDSTASDKDLNAFAFDRGYTLDLILFRELIGAVTNATYFKPYIGYDFIYTDTEAWGFTFSALYARALEAKATPGDEANLGLEMDVEFYIHEFDRFRWSLAYGILFPGGAWNLLDEATGDVVKEAGIAQTLQMNLGIEF